MGVVNTLRQALKNGGDSVSTMWETTKNFSWKNANAIPTPIKPPGMIERGFVGTLKGLVGYPLKLGLKTIDATAGFLLTPIKWVAAAPGKFFKAFPRFAPIATVVGAAVAIGSYFTHRRSEALQENYAGMQAQAMAAQNAQPAYGLAPGEFTQNVEPLMRGGNGVQGGHAEALAAKREAAAAQQAAASTQQATSVA